MDDCRTSENARAGGRMDERARETYGLQNEEIANVNLRECEGIVRRPRTVGWHNVPCSSLAVQRSRYTLPPPRPDQNVRVNRWRKPEFGGQQTSEEGSLENGRRRRMEGVKNGEIRDLEVGGREKRRRYLEDACGSTSHDHSHGNPGLPLDSINHRHFGARVS